MPGLGSLTVYLTSNSTGLERGLAKAEGMLKKFATLAAGYLAVSGVKQLAQESINLAAVQEKAENMLTRTLKNTAGMAEFTAGEMKRWAAEAQNISIFGDEKVMEAQTRLLQMNSVTGDAFRQTRAVALDLASATGQDLTAVMQTLGKALQDPVKGVKQLREYGTSPDMTKTVEERIAAQGKEAAQLMLLADLQQRYAGAAAEAANTISGAFTQNQNALGDLKEGIGFLINEIFDVKGALQTSGGWFAEWADYLRKNAAEIAYSLKSVWIDFSAAAQKMYLLVAPLINQVLSIVKAAALNIMEFFQAVPRWLSGEDYQMKLFEPVYKMVEEYKNIGKYLDQIERNQNQRHLRLDHQYELKLDNAAMSNLTRGTAAGVESGMDKAEKKQQRQKINNPAAIKGSQDAWKIIAAAMQPQNNLPSSGIVSAAATPAASRTPAAIQPQTAARTPATMQPQTAARTPAMMQPQTAAPAVTTIPFFRAQVRSSEITMRDMTQNLSDIVTLLNPAALAARAVTRPESIRTAYDVATAPQAKPENWMTRGLMAVTAFLDPRNNGARFAANASSPVTTEQVAAARKQLDETKKTNSILERVFGNLNPLNL